MSTQNKIEPKSRVTSRQLAESHRRQFNGEDWQNVAVDVANSIPGPTEEEFKELCEGPDPGCECGFCATADWQ